MGFLDFFAMAYTYPERRVARAQVEDFTIDTAQVTDMPWLYETAIKCNRYNDGDWIVVDGTGTLENAEYMHKKWISKLETMPTIPLRDIVIDETFTSHEIED